MTKEAARTPRQLSRKVTVPLIYFARAMDGISKKQILSMAAKVRREIARYDLCLVDPFSEILRISPEGNGADLSRKIVELDLNLLRKCDGVLMDMSIPMRNYIGCSCELVYAFKWKLPVVVYVGNSENEGRHWLKYHATKICHDRKEAMRSLAAIFNDGNDNRAG